MLLKELYSPELIESLGLKIKQYYDAFDVDRFVLDVSEGNWDELKLMQRSDRIVECMHRQLPENFKEAARIVKSIGPSFSGLTATCLPNYISTYGLDDWQTSLDALFLLTQYSSAEFAIRPFLIKYPEITEQKMLTWSNHKNTDVRRLSSEGIRPRLPWGIRLKQYIENPEPVMQILTNLIFDDSEYVQKSVANNLNDISKDHPEVVIDFCKRYWGQKQSGNWIINHGLRTLFKAGNPEVLKLLGYKPDEYKNTKLLDFSSNVKSVSIGEKSTHEFQLKSTHEFQLKSTISQQLPVYLGYRVHYIRKNKDDAYKDFFIKRLKLKPNEVLNGRFTIKWKQLSTRRLYPGVHRIDLLLNTAVIDSISVNLIE